MYADLATLTSGEKTLSKPSARPAVLTSLERSRTSLVIAPIDKSGSLKERESTLSRKNLSKKISEFRQKI